MNNCIQFTLGTEDDLKPLYPYKPANVTLEDFIGLCLNQTLQRDGFEGAWAQVWWQGGSVQVVITSPDTTADVSFYGTQYPKWLAAVTTALNDYNRVYATLNPPPPAPPEKSGIAFLAPFGLAMNNTRSVQLLHYPPTETLSYLDYLYSPTNRRWESLLMYNSLSGSTKTLLETITDLVPVAANGGSDGATAIKPFEGQFGDYVPQMLQVFLSATPSGKATQPVVGYGGPVMDFLQKTYAPEDISPVTNNPPGPLQVLSLFQQQIIPGGPATSFLCTNHPSKFMYYKPGDPMDFKLVLQQDLTAAYWQANMATNPDADPVQTLADGWAYWGSPGQAAAFQQIFDTQVAEFTRPASQGVHHSLPPFSHT